MEHISRLPVADGEDPQIPGVAGEAVDRLLHRRLDPQLHRLQPGHEPVIREAGRPGSIDDEDPRLSHGEWGPSSGNRGPGGSGDPPTATKGAGLWSRRPPARAPNQEYAGQRGAGQMAPAHRLPPGPASGTFDSSKSARFRPPEFACACRSILTLPAPGERGRRSSSAARISSASSSRSTGSLKGTR